MVYHYYLVVTTQGHCPTLLVYIVWRWGGWRCGGGGGGGWRCEWVVLVVISVCKAVCIDRR